MMTRIDELLQDHLVMMLQRERNLVLERMTVLVSKVLDRNAKAYERLGEFPEAIALHQSAIDIIHAVERELRRDEVMRRG